MTLPAHPSDAEAWEWDEGNEEELEKHGISTSEVVQLFENGPKCVPNVRHRAGDWKLLGLTNAGRRLTIVVRVDEVRLTLRAITGWETTVGERARYFKGGK